ncbi:MAG: hypothetical protein KF685_10455 [Acidobacteria bacterium]|nr:hypothetical protein [Acidobacteriota bacterium]
MFLSNYARSLAFVVAVTAFGCSGPSNENSNASTPTAEPPVSSIPFKTIEPIQYQAVAEFSSGNVVEKKFIAKSGSKRRIDHNYGTERQLTVIETTKTVVIDPQRRVYAERPANSGKAEPDFIQDMTRQLLAVREKAEFRELGEENGRVMYSVRVADSDISEIVVFADPTIGMPTRQEFYSTVNSERILRYWFDLTNVELAAEDELFAVPEGYRKISVEEFYRGLK